LTGDALYYQKNVSIFDWSEQLFHDTPGPLVPNALKVRLLLWKMINNDKLYLILFDICIRSLKREIIVCSLNLKTYKIN
jgi:hypothetical protein